MRIRKQAKQALSLIFSTLIAVFAFALLLVTIIDLQTDSTPQLVSDAQPQPEEIAPQPPAVSEQEHIYQEPPVEEPAAPAPAVEQDSTQREKNLKKAFIIIGLAALAAAIVAGVMFLIRHLARRRLYIYEDEDDAPAADELAEREKWESNISNPIPYAATKDEGAKSDIHENISSSFEHEDAGESGMDYADIPRLFSK